MFTHIKEHALISSGTVFKVLILGLFTVLFSFAGTANATTENVVDLPTLTAALADPLVDTINLTADISGITETLVIPVGHPLTLNGGGFTLSFTNLEADGGLPGVDDGLAIQDVATVNDLTVNAGLGSPTTWDGTYAIQVFNTTATLNNVTALGGNGGILANNSAVTLTGSIDVSDNGFGGAEASGASGSLDIGGATFTNSSEAYGFPTVWEDGLTGTAIVGHEADFTEITKGAQYQYYLVPANAIDPSLKDITSFSFPEGAGVITGTDIAVAVPFTTVLTGLTPAITHTGASVSPDTGVAQDFTTPVVYTVTAADASTQDYTVTVTPTPSVLTSINVVPTSSTIDVGETQTYTPTGVDQFGDTMSLTVDNVDSSNVLIATTDRFMFSATGVAEGSVVITFMSTSSGPSVSATADLTVVLPDLTAPVITLLGTTPINVEYNSTYTDDGATALDDRDGDITGSIVTSNPVDTSILGIYTVTYDVSDAAGNDATQVTRTVNVVDTTAPVITLTGVNPQTIEWGAGYTELGATADDGSTVIIDASAVNVGTLGSYLVTYNATDASSNSAIQVTRTVNVVDTNAPTVVSVDSDGQTYNTLTVSPFVITVTFNEDVSVSPDISVSGGAQVVNNCGDVDAKTFCFSYSVPPTQDTEKEIQIMNAEDATGNVMFDNFMHTFLVDTIIPVITLDGADPQTIEWGDGYTELGATADDGSTVVPDASAFVDAVGSYLVTYNATDVSGNPAMTIMRTVNVVDTTAPVITLTGANPQTIEWGAGYTELGATTDDGSALVIDTSDFVDAVGSYTITYDATDASLNAATTETRTVNVVDTTAPIITLTGANPQTIEAGTTGYVELGATTDDGSTVIIDATAFVDAVGSYSVTYNATDASSNSALEVTRTVNVVDTTAPVITLLGSTPLSVRYNSTYTDAGATALDTVDGDVTGSIVTNNPVDTLIPGTYTVTYDVSDVAGNPATQVTRSVTVEQQPASTGSRARRATPAIPATPGISPAFPAIPSANANVAGGLFTFMRHLGLGLSGEDVTALQNRLMAEGVYSGPVTGYFGPLTLGAVQAYQRKMGISDTGFVGPLTLARLNGGLALGNPSSNPLTTQQITEKRTQLLNAMQELVRLLQSQLNAQ